MSATKELTKNFLFGVVILISSNWLTYYFVMNINLLLLHISRWVSSIVVFLVALTSIGTYLIMDSCKEFLKERKQAK